MLDEYCNTLSETAQLELALRLCDEIVPIWDRSLQTRNNVLEDINQLSESQIDVHFLQSVLNDLHTAFFQRIGIKNNKTLKAHLQKMIPPLTNPEWDNTVSVSARLVYTAIFNVLAFIFISKTNEEGETHLSVAINKACDTILREGIYSKTVLEKILLEYRNRTKGSEQETLFFTMTANDAKTIVDAMKKGLKYSKEDLWDSSIHFLEYVPQRHRFASTQADTIVGYLSDPIEYEDDEFLQVLMTNYSYDEFMSETYQS